METCKRITEQLISLREKNPLVHHITNYVTVNDCANITLAVGGSPVMADSIDEVRDMVSIASSLVINLGTINAQKLESMLAAVERAKELGIPVVLDPVGVGATPFRLQSAKKILEKAKLSVIRGNLSEIKSLYGAASMTRGVDSSETLEAGKDGMSEAIAIAKALAVRLEAVVAITGAVDLITDGIKVYLVENGHKLMAKVTGTGCMCTSLIGSYLGVGKDTLTAALSGVVSMGVAGEIACERLSAMDGTGSLKTYILDGIYNLNEEVITKRSKVYEAKL